MTTSHRFVSSALRLHHAVGRQPARPIRSRVRAFLRRSVRSFVAILLLAAASPAVAQLTFAPASLYLGSAEVGETSQPRTASLQNGGAEEATGLAFDTPAGFDADTSACADSLPAGGSCEISITFSPLEPGWAEAALTVTSDQGSAAGLALTGCGLGEQGGTEQHETVLISRASCFGGVIGDQDSFAGSISADGRYIAFRSRATTLHPDDADTTFDVLLRDMTTLETSLVSRAAGATGIKGNGPSFGPAISADGRIVAFYSDANNLHPDDLDGTRDVFVRDMDTHEMTLVSRATGSDGEKANDRSFEPAISADGRYIAFGSWATNLDPDDDDGGFGNDDVYVRDLETHETLLISRASGIDGVKGNGPSNIWSISSDGRYVAFTTSATNIHPEDPDDVVDVYVRDLLTHDTILVSRASGSDGPKGNDNSDRPSIAASGRYVAFESQADNFHPDDPDGGGFPASDVFVRDLEMDETFLISRATGADGEKGNDGSLWPSISADGRHVAFESRASNIHPDDPDGDFAGQDIYARDRQTNETILVSRASGSAGDKGDGTSSTASISANGRYVAFKSGATNLHPDDVNGRGDVYLRDVLGALPQADLGFDPLGLDFGDVEVGSASPPVTTTLSNLASAEITGLAFDTPGSGFSADASDCGATLPAGESCEVAVTFTPPDFGAFEATLTATSDQDASATLDLAGTGVGASEPDIAVSPNSLSFTVPGGGSDTGDLAISNLGGGTLTWDIETAEPAGSVISTWRHAAGTPATASFASRAGRGVPKLSKTLPLGDIQMSQTVDTNINLGLSCPNGPNHLMRRYYFAEHPGVGNPAQLGSVDIAIQEAVESQTLTVNLYTLPSDTPVDTIPVSALSLIGSGVVTISPSDDGTIVNVPVSATVGDTATLDLVVEASVQDVFNLGATNAGETHPGFIMAPACGADEPIRIDSLDPSVHIIMIVNAGEGGGPDGCDNPATIPWLSVVPESGSTVAGETDVVSVMVDAGGMGPGDHEALLCVRSNDPEEPVTKVPVALTVTGTGIPELSFDPTSLDFGDVELGTTSAPQSATLHNTGDDDATELSFDLSSDAFAADTSACGDSLGAGASCDIVVVFTPKAPGEVSEQLQVASAEGASAELDVAGTGDEEVPVPELAFSPANLDFGDVPVGSTSTPLTATLHNTGDADATGLTFTTPDNGFEANTGDCGDVLPAEQSCTVSVSFTPTAPGPTGASLVVSVDEGASAVLGTHETGEDVHMEVASYWGGPILGADIQGDYAYLANGHVLRIVDISKEASPISVSTLHLQDIRDVKVRDDKAYVAGRCFSIVDVSEPSEPNLIFQGGCRSSLRWGQRIELYNDYAFVRGTLSRNARWSIQDPENAVAQTFGVDGDFAIHGDHVYVSVGSPAIRVYDANTLALVGDVDLPGSVRWSAVAAAGGHLYVAAHVLPGDSAPARSALFVFDISDPVSPALTEQIPFDSADFVSNVSRIAAADGRLYVGRQLQGSTDWTPDHGHLHILDISTDPAHPSLISTYQPHGYVRAVLAATEDRAYIAEVSEGFLILDVSDPEEPERLGKLHSPTATRNMVRDGDRLYVSDAWGGFTILDISDTTAPQVLGSYLVEHFDGLGVNAWGIDYQDGRIYLGAGHVGLEVVDVSDPTAPKLLGTHRLPFSEDAIGCSYYWPVRIRGEVAYVGAGRWNGICNVTSGSYTGFLHTFDVGDPRNIRLLGEVQVDASPAGPPGTVVSRGDVVFVGADKGRKDTVDVSDPADPQVIFTEPDLRIRDLAGLEGDRLHVIEWVPGGSVRGIHIQDVSDPTVPVSLGYLPGPDADYCGVVASSGARIEHADLQHGRGYLLDSTLDSSLLLLDVSDSSSPRCLDSVPWLGTSAGFFPDGRTNRVLASEPLVFTTYSGAAGSGNDTPYGLAILNVTGLQLPIEATLSLTGRGIGAALSVTPDQIEFGAIPVGEVGSPQAVTLSNTGNLAAEVTSLSAAATPFERSGGDCPAPPFELTPSSSCTLEYSFSPTTVGQFEQSLTIESNADPVSFTLAGEGIVPPPQIGVDPESFEVTLATGQTGGETLTIGNLGEETLTWTIDTAAVAASRSVQTPAASAEAITSGRFIASSVATPTAGERSQAAATMARGDRIASASSNDAADLASILGVALPGVRPLASAGGVVDCDGEPGLVVHDDGTVENAYGGNPDTVSQVAFVDRFTPSSYPASFTALCVAFATQSPPSLAFEIVILDDDGPGGAPGTELGALSVSADGIPGDLNAPVWHSYDLSELDLVVDSGSLYIGVRWAPADPGVFLTVDESPGKPPGFAGGYWWTDNSGVWSPTQTTFTDYRSMFLRAVEVEVSACDNPGTIPWLSVTPPSGEAPGGATSDVAVGFDATALEPGTFEAVLCVASNDPETPLVEVPVTLTVNPLAPELSFDPPSLDFGPVEVGEISPALPATLTNTGSLDATGLTFDLSNPAFAADPGTCGTTLPAGASCDFSVTFTPAEAGPAAATLRATSAEEASAELPLAGNGTGEPAFTPMALTVDPEERVSNGNGVFEPHELIDVMPSWRNDGNVAASLTGTASQFTGPDGADYELGDEAADYGLVEAGATASCEEVGLCYRLGVNGPAARPATHWMATFDETLSDDTPKTWELHIGDSFADVPRESLFYVAIETLLHSGVTGGCTDSEYCPAGVNTRAQMAIFLLRAIEGAGFVPPPCEEGNEAFLDVPADSLFCPWIEELAARQVTSGCGGDNYCPTDSVTRGQMAVFLLRAALGGEYTPPACAGEFDDVDCSSPFAAWIEDLAARGITGGCSVTGYCPNDAVTRGQMAVFITRAFGLTLYGP